MTHHLRIVNVKADFRALRYGRRIMLGLSAIGLVHLLEEIDQKYRISHGAEWERQRAESDARSARKAGRRIIRHDVAFAAARKGLIPGVDQIFIRPLTASKTRKRRTR